MHPVARSFGRDNATRCDELVEVAVVSLPLSDCIGPWKASDIAASNPSAFAFGRRYRAVPRLIVAQWSLHRELFAIFIDDNQKELGLVHAVSQFMIEVAITAHL
jgi:hypothetical protein